MSSIKPKSNDYFQLTVSSPIPKMKKMKQFKGWIASADRNCTYWAQWIGLLIQTASVIAAILVVNMNVKYSILFGHFSRDTNNYKVETLTDSLVIGYLPILFLSLDALQFFVQIIYFDYFIDMLNLGVNTFQWVQYSLSASLMHVTIALLSGIEDVVTLFFIFTATILMMVHGYFSELDMKGRRFFWVGCIPFGMIWIPLFTVFFYSVSTANNQVPAFVWCIQFIIFALELLFPLFTWLHLQGNKWFQNPFIYSLSFAIVSILSKNALAWIMIGGIR